MVKTVKTVKNAEISDRTHRYLKRTIKKTTSENNKNAKFINDLNLALNYYIEYSINSYNYNNFLIDNYNILQTKYNELYNILHSLDFPDSYESPESPYGSHSPNSLNSPSTVIP
jgi:hypothetical protein